ncbi:MAG: hypothetical protein R3F45_03905 [Gammaproteobacteria bacterium]
MSKIIDFPKSERQKQDEELAQILKSGLRYSITPGARNYVAYLLRLCALGERLQGALTGLGIDDSQVFEALGPWPDLAPLIEELNRQQEELGVRRGGDDTPQTRAISDCIAKAFRSAAADLPKPPNYFVQCLDRLELIVSALEQAKRKARPKGDAAMGVASAAPERQRVRRPQSISTCGADR